MVKRLLLHISLFVTLSLAWVAPVRADLQPEAVAILQKMLQAYATTVAFSCEGSCDDHQDGSKLPPDHRTVTIAYVRPDRFRLAWKQKDFQNNGGTSAIFIRGDKVVFREWNATEDEPEPTLGQAIDSCAGISLGLSYLVPAMLLGDPGYLQFKSLQQLADVHGDDGSTCWKLAGETADGVHWELLIDSENKALREAYEVNTLAAAPSQSAHPVRTHYRFTNIRFLATLPDSAFAEPSPAAATKSNAVTSAHNNRSR